MALCSPARNGELCHTSMSSVTLVSHCFTSLLIFAAFSGLNLHVWLVVMAICEDEFRLKVGPCRRPNGCFILETLKLKTKGAASHRSQGTRGRAGWQTVPLKIVPYEYVHSLVPSVALYTAANTSTGKSNPFLPCCRSGRSIQNWKHVSLVAWLAHDICLDTCANPMVPMFLSWVAARHRRSAGRHEQMGGARPREYSNLFESHTEL